MLKVSRLAAALIVVLPVSALAGPLQDKAAEAEAALNGKNGIEAVSIMRQALIEAWNEAPLAIATATFVTEPADGYGIYTARPGTVFAEGETLRVYLEPIGFGWTERDGYFNSHLTVDFDLTTPDGKVLAGQKTFGRFDFKSHVPNTEYMADLTLNVSGAPAGNYVLELTVNDEIGGGAAKVKLPFSIE